jgi:putative flippase GtrA
VNLIRDTYLRFQVLVHEVAKFGVVGAVGFVVQLVVQNALHSGAKIGALTSIVIAFLIASVVTFVGNRKGKGLTHETILFVALNGIALLIQVGIVDVAYYEMGFKDGLSYNIASVIGIGIGTLFRLFTDRKFVFRHAPAAGAAEELQPASTGPMNSV